MLSLFLSFSKGANANRGTPYQGTTTEEDHEDDERLKPVVLHNQVAGFPEEPPALSPAHCDVNVAALVLSHTSCVHTEEEGKHLSGISISCVRFKCVLGRF